MTTSTNKDCCEKCDRSKDRWTPLCANPSCPCHQSPRPEGWNRLRARLHNKYSEDPLLEAEILEHLVTEKSASYEEGKKDGFYEKEQEFIAHFEEGKKAERERILVALKEHFDMHIGEEPGSGEHSEGFEAGFKRAQHIIKTL